MRALYATWLALLLLLMPGTAVLAEDLDGGPAITPPRLSYIDGDISFWRPGAEDWLEARRNTPIAVGDELYSGAGANFELQIDARAFVRADERTQIALVNQATDFIQFRVASGRVSLHLNRIDPGMTVEVATPNAVFRIAHEGYYRLDVDQGTHFITRRGGRAMVIPAGGRAMDILASEDIVVTGDDPARVESYVAPEPDQWDRWNYARSDDLLDAVSARYLPPGVYGADELDHYGNWRVVPEYGPVWIPDHVAGHWAPYSAGSWVWDPYYEWTWIDDAPWGWAPFHYGRWLSIDGVWAWAPGPVALRRPAYSPALVAFFWAGDDVSVRIGIGTSGLFWVSLGWGEPVVPWWGRTGFRGRPWWGGWHGPRVVNNVVIHDRAVVNPSHIIYRNSRLAHAVAHAPRDKFGRPQERARLTERIDIREMDRLHGTLPVRPGPESVAVGVRKGNRPPPETTTRPVLGTRAPSQTRRPWPDASPAVKVVPPAPVRIVPLPKREESSTRRPEFGGQGADVRPRPPEPTRYRETRPPSSVPTVNAEARDSGRIEAEPTARIERKAPQPREPQLVRDAPPPQDVRENKGERADRNVAAPAARGQERARDEPRSLPGKPANQMFRRGGQTDEERDERRPGR
jgi:hypothetical protein